MKTQVIESSLSKQKLGSYTAIGKHPQTGISFELGLREQNAFMAVVLETESEPIWLK